MKQGSFFASKIEVLMQRNIKILPDRLKNSLLGLWLLSALLMTSCASPVSHQQVQVFEPVEQQLSTEIYFYPNHGQSPTQQDRDRYECYLWAVQQSGFDPSSPQLAPHQRVVVEPIPVEGHDTVVGTVTGALVGAVIGSPHHSGQGAVVGAVAGALIGASSDSTRQQQTASVQERYNREAASRTAAIERKADNYRRAMKACLEGRDYSVR
jgi:hypothetical protein